MTKTYCDSCGEVVSDPVQRSAVVSTPGAKHLSEVQVDVMITNKHAPGVFPDLCAKCYRSIVAQAFGLLIPKPNTA